MEAQSDAIAQGFVGIFVVSYMLIVGTVLMNIVVGESLLGSQARTPVAQHGYAMTCFIIRTEVMLSS